MAKNVRAVLVFSTVVLFAATVAARSAGDDTPSEPIVAATTIEETTIEETTTAPVSAADRVALIESTTAPSPPTTARRVPQMTLDRLIPTAPWQGASRFSRVETSTADFRQRLIPSSWDVIDNAGVLPEPGTLTLEFHEAVAGESPDWVGLHDGCQSSGWLIDWIEGDGDIGIIRRVMGTIQIPGEECPEPFPNWPFPKGWVRVSFDGDQLILGRQRTDLLVQRAEETPVNPAHVPTPDGEFRQQLLHGLWEIVDDDADGRRSVVAFEEGHPDWIHSYDGCSRRSTWIREWNDAGFVAESDQLVLSTRNSAHGTGPCELSAVGLGMLHDGPVDVVVTPSGVELRRGDETIVLERR